MEGGVHQPMAPLSSALVTPLKSQTNMWLQPVLGQVRARQRRELWGRGQRGRCGGGEDGSAEWARTRAVE